MLFAPRGGNPPQAQNPKLIPSLYLLAWAKKRWVTPKKQTSLPPRFKKKGKRASAIVLPGHRNGCIIWPVENKLQAETCSPHLGREHVRPLQPRLPVHFRGNIFRTPPTPGAQGDAFLGINPSNPISGSKEAPRRLRGASKEAKVRIPLLRLDPVNFGVKIFSVRCAEKKAKMAKTLSPRGTRLGGPPGRGGPVDPPALPHPSLQTFKKSLATDQFFDKVVFEKGDLKNYNKNTSKNP